MPNSAEVTTNIRPIEVKSYIANIEESVTPLKMHIWNTKFQQQ